MRLDLLEGVRTLQWSGHHPSHASASRTPSFAGDGLELVELGDFRDADAHRWRAELRRQPAA